MKFRHQKYTYAKPFGSARHSWEIVGPKGGVHFHVSMTDGYGDTAGLEFHFMAPPSGMENDAPSQLKCWLLNCPCWHDGTSLYASETLWPMIKPMLANGDHDTIFRFLQQEYESHFKRECEAV